MQHHMRAKRGRPRIIIPLIRRKGEKIWGCRCTYRTLCSKIHSIPRKLPGVSKSLISPGPADDPSKHQGRIRTHAHVEGQFASYIYVPINIGNDGIKEMFKIVKKALRFVMKSEPLIQPIIEDFERVTRGNDDCELHISLSRPVYLFHHQREAFKQAVKIMASSQTS